MTDPAKPRGTWTAWTVTWLSYATYYFGRKNLSVVKATVGRELGAHALYGVETTYLAAYALGQYGSGWLGDRIGSRRLVGVGMLVAAAACFAFGLSSAGFFFLATSTINGLAQSTGWPGNVKAMQEWTSPAIRGRVMGIWATCYQAGGIFATGFAAWLLSHFGWRGAYVGPAIVLAGVGIVVLTLLRPGPNGASPASRHDPEALAARKAVALSRTTWSYGASYFFIKLIRYSLLFWLPYYLEVALHYSKGEAGYLSTSFEIGGVVGTIALGWASDRFRRFSRSLISAASLVGLAGALVIYSRVGADHAANFAAMALVGALLYGPDALLSGAAAQDLGGPRAAALAIGMINGLGSLGAVLQEVVTRVVSAAWGWMALFQVFVVFALLAALALVPTFAVRPRDQAVTE